jgi:hypothetical protein
VIRSISAISFRESCSVAACAESSIHFSQFSRMAHHFLGMCLLLNPRDMWHEPCHQFFECFTSSSRGMREKIMPEARKLVMQEIPVL